MPMMSAIIKMTAKNSHYQVLTLYQALCFLVHIYLVLSLVLGIERSNSALQMEKLRLSSKLLRLAKSRQQSWDWLVPLPCHYYSTAPCLVSGHEGTELVVTQVCLWRSHNIALAPVISQPIRAEENGK